MKQDKFKVRICDLARRTDMSLQFYQSMGRILRQPPNQMIVTMSFGIRLEDMPHKNTSIDGLTLNQVTF